MKIFKDLMMTLYDDTEGKLISLPRVVFALSCLCVVTSWIADQFLGYEFKNFTQLVAWCVGNAGAYVGKKYIDGGK